MGSHRQRGQAGPGHGSLGQRRAQAASSHSRRPTSSCGQGNQPPPWAGSQRPPTARGEAPAGPFHRQCTEVWEGWVSCLKCLGSVPEAQQLQVQRGSDRGPQEGGPGRGQRCPATTQEPVALELELGFPAGTRRTQKRGQKRGQELLGGNQGCQGDGLPLRGRGGFRGQPQFPNPGCRARVVWGKERGERGGPQTPPPGLSPCQCIRFFVSMRSPCTRKWLPESHGAGH